VQRNPKKPGVGSTQPTKCKGTPENKRYFILKLKAQYKKINRGEMNYAQNTKDDN
jgi:hypothetical protein